MIIDIIILIVLVLSAITGYRRGIISQLGAFTAIVIALIICRLGGDACTAAFAEQVGANDPSQSGWSMYTAGIVANVILFVVVWLAVTLLFGMIKKVAHAVLLGPLDGLAGGCFRFLASGLAISILLNLWLVISPGSTYFKSHHGYCNTLFDMLVGFAPWLWGQFHVPATVG
ncbi:MAG: CvpA family protein [Paramuribaculum sp.]|nr:CvpA family protein [Paramuribaculum sp.]